MRERLAAAFVALAVAVLLLAGGLRLIALQEVLRDAALAEVRQDTSLLSAVMLERRRAREPVTEELLERLVGADMQLDFVSRDGVEMTVTGPGFEEGEGEVVTASRQSPAGTITLSTQAGSALDTFVRDPWSVVMLGLLVALLAGLAGWWMAIRLSAPFQQLAVAAAALGRGRFDLSLPRTRVPEARAISRALEVSAAQLEARVSREREFAEHASHELRTPLTSLRMELEDLTLRDDVPGDVKDAAGRCIDRVDAVNASADQLVAMTRSGALVEGAETSLEELAREVAQQWADQLAGRRTVTAAVEGDLSVRLTPGPLEQLLELLLSDVKLGRGPVRLVFVGDEGHVRARLMPADPGHRQGLEAATALARSHGGRISESAEGSDVEILLPRR